MRGLLKFLTVAICVLAWRGTLVCASENAQLDSLMNLFMPQYVDSLSTDSLRTIEKFDEPEQLQQESNLVLQFRISMLDALQNDSLEKLKQILEMVDSYEKTSNYFVLFGEERIILKYLLGDFDFLCNVDSIRHYNDKKISLFGNLGGELKKRIKAELDSGNMEKSIEKIEGEGNRNFVYILFNGLFYGSDSATALIEERKFSFEKRNQLEYLVDIFWNKKVTDHARSRAFTLGPMYVGFLGKIADKVDNTFGLWGGLSKDWNDYFFEFLMSAHWGENSERDSLDFFYIGVDLNVGYTFMKKGDSRFWGYLTAGFGSSTFIKNGSDKSDEKKNDYPDQFFPEYGGGVAYDFVSPLNDGCIGLRYRLGIKNIWADKVLGASGFRIYTSIEIFGTSIAKKSVKFDYSEIGAR